MGHPVYKYITSCTFVFISSDIQRYSDKYHGNGNSDSTIGWTPDWERLPKELKIRVRKPKDARESIIKHFNNDTGKWIKKISIDGR